ncbi:hypothetical protein DVH05_000729 [Phytophthora capsici]|nr:hypothetical protein DVH05_000729 [Phytophthora capsici]
MEWINGGIYIVELPAHEHEECLRYLDKAISPDADVETLGTYLVGHGTSYVEDRPDDQPAYEPDQCYGPIPEAGSHLPIGVENYLDWRTLVVEVGYSRRWGDAHGHLDWKAQRWAEVPGVYYVLCVAVTAGLATAEYKLYRVYRPRTGRLRYRRRLENPNEPPVPIFDPTVVHFDARTLLGLEPDDPLPRDPPQIGDEFPDPLVVDLYQVLVRAQRLFNV